MKRKIIIERGEDTYGAYVPSIGGCTAAGDTIEEAKKNILEIIEFHLEGLAEDGDSVPDISDGFSFEIDKMGKADFWYKTMEAFVASGFTPVNAKWDNYGNLYTSSSAGIRPSDNSPTCHYKIFLKQNDKEKQIRLELWFGTTKDDRDKYLFEALEKAKCIDNRICANKNYATLFDSRRFDGENKESWESTIAWLVKGVRKFDKEITPIRQRAEAAWERRCHRKAA